MKASLSIQKEKLLLIEQTTINTLKIGTIFTLTKKLS